MTWTKKYSPNPVAPVTTPDKAVMKAVMPVKEAFSEPQYLLGVTAIRPPVRHGLEKLRYILHDPDKGHYLGRTPKSWVLILLFYSVYYLVLAGFCFAMWNLFYLTINEKEPKYKMDESIIGSNPGVSYRPRQPEDWIKSDMIWLKHNGMGQEPTKNFTSLLNVDWAKRYQGFIKQYENLKDTQSCDNNTYQTDGGVSCKFDKSMLGPCAEYPYGYEVTDLSRRVEPCILLKVNRIFDWKPEPYSKEMLKNDESIPDVVKTLVMTNPKRLYIHCKGENAADREVLEGNMKYYPEDQSISYKYFPYTHSGKNYHNPVVAVKFSGLPVGQLLHIECKLYAKGMRHSKKYLEGQTHFTLFLHKD